MVISNIINLPWTSHGSLLTSQNYFTCIIMVNAIHLGRCSKHSHTNLTCLECYIFWRPLVAQSSKLICSLTYSDLVLDPSVVVVVVASVACAELLCGLCAVIGQEKVDHQSWSSLSSCLFQQLLYASDSVGYVEGQHVADTL